MIAAVAFDLDDTLAESKTPISTTMADLLVRLGRLVPVCIISGGRFEQFRDQVVRLLPPADPALESLHLMPTCGTRYYRHTAGEWRQIYADDLTPEEKRDAIEAIEAAAKGLGMWEPDEIVTGDRIEDRGSQITFSALGQRAEVARKKTWDPDGAKRQVLREEVQRALPALEVRAGGSTSIDITRKGIDKAYGVRHFAAAIDVDLGSILFVGDRLDPGGNDAPVIELGVQTHAVRDCRETESLLPRLISALQNGSGGAWPGDGHGMCGHDGGKHPGR